MSLKNKSFFEFRIIAGSLKGKKIKSPNLGITRPPLSRLRKAIFDFLNPYLRESYYLDLFSGTGSYLFEALSRGAQKVFGVEQEASLATAINQQAQKFSIADRLFCYQDDVYRILPRLNDQAQQFDIIMMAPPQYLGIIPKTLTILKDLTILKKNGLIICQHDSSETKKIDFGEYSIYQQRKYGNTTFTILTKS
ncbi:MAG: 16S rRNA (guanine(966)-N(2))-methyltransferase RsmD [FCB group bacterium]|nr:16S rRNA (guanine(966)-N(2))-methyltransferase RsmD [FCB group bacterium]